MKVGLRADVVSGGGEKALKLLFAMVYSKCFPTCP